MQNVSTLPTEILDQILLTATAEVSDLGNNRCVCKTFQTIIEDNHFMNACLAKLKGNRFGITSLVTYPENFFILDKDITRIFKTTLSKHLFTDYPEARLEKLNHIQQIALSNFASRVFSLQMPDETIYYRVSETDFNKLQEISCKQSKEWEDILASLATKLTEYDFPKQIKLHFPANLPFLTHIEKKYRTKSRTMATLCEQLGITDIFFSGPSLLAINTSNRKPTDTVLVQDAYANHRKTFCKYLLQYYHASNSRWESKDGYGCMEKLEVLAKDDANNMHSECLPKILPYTKLFVLLFNEIQRLVDQPNHFPNLHDHYWLADITLKQTDDNTVPYLFAQIRTDNLWKKIHSRTNPHKYDHVLNLFKS